MKISKFSEQQIALILKQVSIEALGLPHVLERHRASGRRLRLKGLLQKRSFLTS
jgi:hypothetical protein